MEKMDVLEVYAALESINLVDPSLFDQLAGLISDVDSVLSSEDREVFDKKESLNRSVGLLQKRLTVL